MKRNLITMTLILISTILITGCWDRTEVDKLSIVIGLGIDEIPGANRILLTAQVVNPSAMKTRERLRETSLENEASAL